MDVANGVQRVRHVPLGSIKLDPEFANLIAKPSQDEQQELLSSLCQPGGGGNEPLIVWKWRGQRILLVGYRDFPFLRQSRRTYPVIERDFANREKAKLFIVKHHIARRVLTPLNLSYLRGLYYDEEKTPAGGDRRSADFQQVRTSTKSLDAVAEIFSISRWMLKRDSKFAKAVNALAKNGGSGVIPLLLARESKLSRGRIMALAKKLPHEQRQILGPLQVGGRLPRFRRSESTTITVPREPEAMVQTLCRRLTEEQIHEVFDALKRALTESKNDGQRRSNGR